MKLNWLTLLLVLIVGATALTFGYAGSLARAALFNSFGALADQAVSAYYAVVLDGTLHRFNQALVRENEDLKAQLHSVDVVRKENEVLKQLAQLHVDSKRSYAYGRVIEDVPGGISHAVAIALGEGDGIITGSAVLWTKNILFGSISEVHEHHSIIKTLADPSTKIPVKVGSHLVSALLVGGSDPYLDLIPADTAIASGDSIFTAPGHDMVPADLFIGEVSAVSDKQGTVLKTARIKFPYNIQSVSEVFVIIK